MLRREVETAEKRYQDLRDEKESLIDQQVGPIVVENKEFLTVIFAWYSTVHGKGNSELLLLFPLTVIRYMLVLLLMVTVVLRYVLHI